MTHFVNVFDNFHVLEYLIGNKNLTVQNV